MMFASHLIEQLGKDAIELSKNAEHRK